MSLSFMAWRKWQPSSFCVWFLFCLSTAHIVGAPGLVFCAVLWSTEVWGACLPCARRKAAQRAVKMLSSLMMPL